MNIVEALEICITRHEIGRDCTNCRFKGEACERMHRKAIDKIREAERLRKEISK